LQNDANNVPKEKNLAFKISHKGKKKVPPKTFEDTDNTSDDIESDDEISILTNKIKRMLRKQESKRKDKRFRTKDGKVQDERIVCYGCKKPKHFKLECLDQVEEKNKNEKKKKFSNKKCFMSTWEDLDSSSSDSEKEANISLMTDVIDNSMSEDSNNEVDFSDIDSLRLAYQETISNNGMIASAYKTMKRNYKNACKEIKLMQHEKASLNDISLKSTELLQVKERLCNENRNLKRYLAVQNTSLKHLEKELVLIREKLGKRPIESNETNIDDIITENITLRKVLSHSNKNEKFLDMLIKSSRKSHDKK